MGEGGIGGGENKKTKKHGGSGRAERTPKCSTLENINLWLLKILVSRLLYRLHIYIRRLPREDNPVLPLYIAMPIKEYF